MQLISSPLQPLLCDQVQGVLVRLSVTHKLYVLSVDFFAVKQRDGSSYVSTRLQIIERPWFSFNSLIPEPQIAAIKHVLFISTVAVTNQFERASAFLPRTDRWNGVVYHRLVKANQPNLAICFTFYHSVLSTNSTWSTFVLDDILWLTRSNFEDHTF